MYFYSDYDIPIEVHVPLYGRTEVGCIVPPWGTIRHGALLRVLNSTPWGTISVDFPNSAPGEGALLGKMV